MGIVSTIGVAVWTIAMRAFTLMTATAPGTTGGGGSGGGGNSVAENSLMSGVVKWAAGIGGGLIALFLIVSIVKNAVGYAKGSGSSSIFKIIGEALFLILLIGLIFIAVRYTTLGNTASGIAQQGVTIVEQQAQQAGLGGSGSGGQA